MPQDRKEATRRRWMELLVAHRADFESPGSAEYWSPSRDCASRDELRTLQNDKLKVLTPFLYENSDFYRRRFDLLGLTPDDIQTVDDLSKWPPVDKKEMVADLMANPPWGTYTTHDDTVWEQRGWTLFATSGTTGLPRVFRYSKFDLEQWRWANARALWSLGARRGDSVFLVVGFGPHVWAWGVNQALAHMGVPCIPGGGMTAEMRCNIIERYKPTILATLPSQLLRLGRVMQEMGMDPAKSSIKTLFTGGEPAAGISSTRARLEDMWGAKLVEFYGCTEASPHSGGYSCPASHLPDQPMHTHLMEDFQVWELVDPDTMEPVPEGARGITVCTNMNSESSSQLRFIVGDYTTFDTSRCACGRTHVRAIGGFSGRADDLINLRGMKFYPSVVEEGVRAVEGIGDEYDVRIETNNEGIDIMTVRVEHAAHKSPQPIIAKLENELQTRIEVRCQVEVLAPDTFPKTEFKAKRVFDNRDKN
ncbi:MAG: AMP-binding protein [Fimbriimonadaceae bacterium]|nr:AMP-binding protein [Alphaproteobacteria bacterium]